MSAYYNEFDPFAAQWLRNLIAAGHIADGEVDERSITEVQPDDLQGFTQCHFFAGIGGWSYALRLAGWPDDRLVWTGSCPCQPFSAAGKGKGTDDPRHLWPEFHRLIAECRPATVFGEQVAAKAGRLWLDGVRADLEKLAYAVGAADLCAAGIGAPHIRQRLWWVADAATAGPQGGSGRRVQPSVVAADGEAGGRVVDAERERRRERPTGSEDAANAAGASQDAWRGVYVGCADERARRIESSIEPLAHGVPARVGRLRGYGNAIVPQVAAEFIAAYMDCRP